jgi:hypothetical protein
MADPTRYPLITSLLEAQAFAARYPVVAEIIEADFKTAEKKFVEYGIEADEIKNYFEQFKTLKPRIKEATDRDIDQWVKKGWEKFKTFVDELKGTKSKQQLKKSGQQGLGADIPDAELVAENEDWWVYRITSHSAARVVGAKTHWCIVASQKHWDHESKDSNFYFLISKNIPAPGSHEEPHEGCDIGCISDPWAKIALEVTKKTGRKQYWDVRDKSHDRLPTEISASLPSFPVSASSNIVVDGKSYTWQQFAVAEGLTVKGDLDLRKMDSKLPNNLTVGGTLFLNRNTDTLPSGLKVGSLDISKSNNIGELPPDIQIKNDFNAEFSLLHSIPALKLKGDLTISDSAISALPSGLEVGGDLDIMNTQITSLPEDLKVGGAIFVDDPDSDEIEVPEHLKDLIH